MQPVDADCYKELPVEHSSVFAHHSSFTLSALLVIKAKASCPDQSLSNRENGKLIKLSEFLHCFFKGRSVAQLIKSFGEVLGV